MNVRQIPVLKPTVVSVIVLIFLIMAGSFTVRGFILRKAIDSFNSRIRGHNYSAHWDGAEFRGINTVFVKGIYFQSRISSDELFMDSVSVRIRILPLFLKRIRIREFECRTISIRYQAEKRSFVKAVPKQGVAGGPFVQFRSKDMAELAFRNIRRMFNYTPAKTRINRVQVKISSAGSPTEIGIHGLTLFQGNLSARIVFAGDKTRVEVPVKGRFDKSAEIIEVSMSKADTSLLPIPILQEKYGISSGFDSLAFSVDLSKRSRHLLDMDGTFSFAGFILNGERLSTQDIRIDHFRSSFLVHLGPQYLELDSSTRADLNKISLLPYLRFSMANDPEIEFKLLPVKWDAGDFFSSLPQGMFTSLTGLRARGTLHYFLDFRVNLEYPDSLFFDTRLRANDFNVVSYGTDDYRKLNGSFLHHAYERGRLAASFVVGDENPDFVPFDQISPYLRFAVMTSEDGSFFIHNGFNPGAFRESIATNIREKRFARGGSTITMQLVKNVFLTRNKTVARKIEEALIVWLIENKNLVPKQRMYEVYLNLIEWGPGVYGVGQASRFYFNKPPAELTLAESIFLASIVPHPKWYKYSFETNGVTRPFFVNYFDRLKELMVRKEFIAPADTLGAKPLVYLTGAASQIFAAPDTVASSDSVIIKELELVPPL